MAVAHKATGTLATIANNATSQNVTIPTYTHASGDFHVLLMQKNAVGFTLSAPVGWTQVFQNEWDPVSGREHITAAFVKAAVSGDSGTTISASQGAAGGFTVFAAQIITFSGGDTSSLLDATAASVQENEPADAITFGAFDPTSTDCTVFALGFYAEDTTTLAGTFGTPVFTTVADTETAQGTDLTMGVAIASSTGTAIGSGNTWATTSAVDNASTGVLFAVKHPAAGGGASVEVPAASLALTGYTPTVSATANVSVTVPAGSLSLTGYTPTVTATAHVSVEVPAAALSFTAYAPTVTTGANTEVEVPAAALALTGFAPTVTTTAHQVVSVPAASLALTGYAPSVSLGPLTVSVPAATLTLTGYAPTVTVSSEAEAYAAEPSSRPYWQTAPTTLAYWQTSTSTFPYWQSTTSSEG